MENKQQFEERILNTCNKVAAMMYEQSKKMNGGVSEITKEEAFNMAKKLTFKSFAAVAGCKEEVDALITY